MPNLVDSYGRHIDYLRLSVTDCCNYHCLYCRPPGAVHHGSQRQLLDHDEMLRLVRLFSELGVCRVRLTGGEPLLRRNLAELAAGISRLPSITDLSLSSNGHLLERLAVPLRAAGVGRVNISLDSLEPENFSRISGGGDLRRVIRGIAAAQAAGLSPVKLNMVVMRGINDHEIAAMLEFALARELELRFIETMPVGSAGAGSMVHYYPAARILDRIRRHCGSQLLPLHTHPGPGPARYYRAGNSNLKVGVISAVSRHFCKTCNRVRLTARGDLVLCLGQQDRISLHAALQRGCSDAQIRQEILAAIARKPQRHDFLHGAGQPVTAPMVSLGG